MPSETSCATGLGQHQPRSFAGLLARGSAGGGVPAMLTAMTTLSPQARAMMVRTLGEGRMCMR